MRNFCLKTILFLIPIFLIAISMEYLIRQIPNDYSYKNKYLDDNSDIIEVLILGSSHAYRGINPSYFKGYSFNASHVAQSINYDYEIINKYKEKWSKLKFIVIPIDYFTLFSRTETGIQAWRVKNYNIYYNLNLSSNVSDYSELLSLKLKTNLGRLLRYYILDNSSITCDTLGYGNVKRKSKNLLNSGIEAAKRHTKSDYSYLNESVIIINSILNFASERGIQVILFTSPAYQSYVSNLNSEQLNITIDTAMDLANNYENCTYINLLENNSFKAVDFRDADHLNANGAKILSKKIDSLIRNVTYKNSIQ